MAGKIMDAVVGSVTQVLSDRLFSYVSGSIQSPKNFGQKTEKLYEAYETVSSMLEEAERLYDQDEAVKRWLERLRRLRSDIQHLKEEIDEKSRDKSRKVVIPLTEKIDAILTKLEDIRGDVAVFPLRPRRKRGRSDADFPTTSLVDKSAIFGRTRDAETVIASLISDDQLSGNSVEVLSIEGMGGVGKTTLAQLVYNDDKIEKHFQIRGWVRVSPDFDESRITKALIESISNEAFPLSQLDSMHRRLLQILSGRRFLVVLDDAWNEDNNAWKSLTLPFRLGAQGSRILVTTRCRRVSAVVGTVPPHTLRCLSEDDAWKLFEKEVFDSSSSSDHPALATVGRDIVRRCRGLPLALKIFAGILRHEFNVDKWHMVLQSSAWDEPENGILTPLKVSFHSLSENLQQCFAFCSIFPKGYEFDKHRLVLMWMALGFIESKPFSKPELVGATYFDDLFARFFFQISPTNESRYKMHDVIHDLAQSVSRETCIRLHDDNWINGIPPYARHASIVCVDLEQQTIDAIRKLERLETLVFFARGDIVDFDPSRRCIELAVKDDLFCRLKHLRLLDLSGTGITTLSDSVGELRCLRLLDLSWTDIEGLPETVCTLHWLETLMLNGCRNLARLPYDLRRLTNLRHLAMEGDMPNLLPMPDGLANLTYLKTLSKFVVGRRSDLSNLGRLRQLEGTLSISELQRVGSANNAKEARLKEKQRLQKLELRWRDDFVSRQGLQEAVMEAVRPHHNIQHLVIFGYRGITLPSWVASLHKLVSLSLQNCRQCDTLPYIAQLPCLKELHVVGLHQVRFGYHDQYREAVQLFPSLETLELRDLPYLYEGFVEGKESFPCLLELEVVDCPRLATLLHQYTSLRKLILRNCKGLRSCPVCPFLQHLVLDGCRELLPSRSLRELVINHMDERQLLPSEGGLKELDSLQKLVIESCPRLVALPDELPTKIKYLEISSCGSLTHLPGGLKNISSLEILIIKKCSRVETLEEVELPTMLKELQISSCQNLRTLPRSVQSLSSLVELKIWECPKICSFPERLPNALHYLVISSSPLLEEQCRKGQGSEWAKIQHIPMILVNEEWLSFVEPTSEDTFTRVFH